MQQMLNRRLKYSLMVAPKTLREQKVTITLVEQGYEFTEGR